MLYFCSSVKLWVARQGNYCCLHSSPTMKIALLWTNSLNTFTQTFQFRIFYIQIAPQCLPIKDGYIFYIYQRLFLSMPCWLFQNYRQYLQHTHTHTHLFMRLCIRATTKLFHANHILWRCPSREINQLKTFRVMALIFPRHLVNLQLLILFLFTSVSNPSFSRNSTTTATDFFMLDILCCPEVQIFVSCKSTSTELCPKRSLQ